MAIKITKTRSSGRRIVASVDYKKVLTTDKPTKSLLAKNQKQGGRNNRGVITTRHQGGGHKQMYRIIDFKRNKDNIPAIVKTVEYDPNRTSFISLVAYADGEKRYIIAPKDIKVGNKVISGDKVEIANGNTMCLDSIPEGTVVHNVELKPGLGGQIVRSAGSSAQILGKDETGTFVIIRLSSGEIRKFDKRCRATIGSVSNEDHNLIKIGKAGRNRWKGIRPTVRGSAMNPNDHPHGGGEGRSPVGKDAPRTPWGKRHMGVKTRNKKKPSTNLIIRRRNAK